MFEKATRLKFRFSFKGQMSTEDLWDLRVEELDNIFKELNSQLKTTKEESLLDKVSLEDEVLQTKVEIIRHIVSVKMAEKEARKLEMENRAKKLRILEILAQKQDESLLGKTEAELLEMVNSL